METIYCLIDYRGHFGSKYDAVPYNSGMNKELLSMSFASYRVELIYMFFSDVMTYEVDFWKDKVVIYTSSEDTGYHYKSFIEDVIYYLELTGARLVPPYKYLKANNNKVFMELLRKTFNSRQLHSVSSVVFGTFEEMDRSKSFIEYPAVYKQAAGAMSKGVGLAYNQEKLFRNIKKIARTRQYLREWWEIGRLFKYPGYTRQSRYRNKFIIQNFIPGLSGDYKVLVFGDKYYVLKRDNSKGDFRASGSGIRNFVKVIPQGILEYASLCKETMGVPNVSLDIAYDGKTFFLVEFQCLFFGSYTLTYSDFYWHKTEENVFVLSEGKSVLEEEYASSIVKHSFRE